MNGMQVLGFPKEYPTVNFKIQKEDEKGYEYSILILYTLQNEKDFKVKN